MRLCDRCGHDNAGHLKFCSGCGRRLATGWPASPAPDHHDRLPAQRGAGPHGLVTAAYAPTMALTPAPERPTGPPTPGGADLARVPTSQAPAPAPGVKPLSGSFGAPPDQDGPRAIVRAWDALRYVFLYIRGRIDAEDQKRGLIGERDGAARLIDGALFDLGQILLSEPTPAPELADLMETVARARARRNAAISDLAAGEKLQASDDLRLGIDQSNAESEWKTCEARAAELDSLLRRLDDDRRGFMEEMRRLQSAAETADIAARNLEIAILLKKHAVADEQYDALREKAAALRATTLAARAKFDQATAARRQSSSTMTATLSAHARDRAEAEQQLRQLTVQIGRTAKGLGLSRVNLLSGYAHVSRLEATVAEREHQIAALQDAIRRYEPRKLALGGVMLVIIAAACGFGLWALVR